MTDETELAAVLWETDSVDLLAKAALAWVAARLTDPATVEAVARALEEHDWFTPRGYAWPCCTCGVEFPSNDEAEVHAHVATAALAVVRGLLGGTGGEG